MYFAPVGSHVVGATKGVPTVCATKGLFPLVGFLMSTQVLGASKTVRAPRGRATMLTLGVFVPPSTTATGMWNTLGSVGSGGSGSGSEGRDGVGSNGHIVLLNKSWSRGRRARRSRYKHHMYQGRKGKGTWILGPSRQKNQNQNQLVAKSILHCQTQNPY